MPIYIKFDGVKGDVTAEGAGAGGVWKTSNFLLTGAARSGPTARPKIKVFICPSDPSVVEVSRISLSPNGAGVNGRDPAARAKVAQLFDTAKNQGPTGRLYIATDMGVYGDAGHSNRDARGRLLVGNDDGIWRSGAGSRRYQKNNLKQFGLGAHGSAIEIYVTGANGIVEDRYRLERATVSRHPGGMNVVLCDGSVR